MKRLAADELARAIGAGSDGPAEVEALESRSWSSITFSGERHRLRLRFTGEQAQARADEFIAALPERDFALRGHLVADIALVADERDDAGASLMLEVLTVESD